MELKYLSFRRPIVDPWLILFGEPGSGQWSCMILSHTHFHQLHANCGWINSCHAQEWIESFNESFMWNKDLYLDWCFKHISCKRNQIDRSWLVIYRSWSVFWHVPLLEPAKSLGWSIAWNMKASRDGDFHCLPSLWLCQDFAWHTPLKINGWNISSWRWMVQIIFLSFHGWWFQPLIFQGVFLCYFELGGVGGGEQNLQRVCVCVCVWICFMFNWRKYNPCKTWQVRHGVHWLTEKSPKKLGAQHFTQERGDLTIKDVM